LDKLIIEKEIQELEGREDSQSKVELSIAKSKIEALNSIHYEKI